MGALSSAADIWSGNSPAKGYLTKREAKQFVRRVCTVGDVSVHDGEIVIEVSTSELRKSQARRAPYKSKSPPRIRGGPGKALIALNLA